MIVRSGNDDLSFDLPSSASASSPSFFLLIFLLIFRRASCAYGCGDITYVLGKKLRENT